MLLIFGLGKSAQELVKLINMPYIGTNRSSLDFKDVDLNMPFTHILFSIPPNENGDIAFSFHAEKIAKMPHLRWIGCYSSTSVYGNYNGNFVDENSALLATDHQGLNRITAENQFKELSLNRPDLSVNIFRLAGIYGKGSSVVDKIKSGNFRIIRKANQFFSRIHIEDIAQITHKTMEIMHKGFNVYNVADDEPTPPETPYLYALEKLKLDIPSIYDYETLQDLSPMLQHFYASSKKVMNNKVKSNLGITLKYPNFRVGIDNILEEDLC